jgi:DNA-binding transcriptional LysR family regulator
MPRLDVNRSGELEAFVLVVNRGGFSAAARELGMTPSEISKLVGRLEERLGARLLHRSTRKVALTGEGRHFYDRGTRVLADLDEAERCAAGGGAPRGRVSLNASIPFGHKVLVPLLPRLLREHPGITVDLTLTDRIVDLVDERTDIAIRWGTLPPSELIARKLGDTRQVVVGARSYLAQRGTPRRPAELEGHDRLGWTYPRAVVDWPFRVAGKTVEVKVDGPVRVSDGETLRQLCIAGMGLARLSRYHVDHDIAAGRLVPVLEKQNPDDRAPIHAVFSGRGGGLSSRVRVVLDFLERHARISPGS